MITIFTFLSDVNLSQFTIYYVTDNGWLITENIARLLSEVRYKDTIHEHTGHCQLKLPDCDTEQRFIAFYTEG